MAKRKGNRISFSGWMDRKGNKIPAGEFKQHEGYKIKTVLEIKGKIKPTYNR